MWVTTTAGVRHQGVCILWIYRLRIFLNDLNFCVSVFSDLSIVFDLAGDCDMLKQNESFQEEQVQL